MSISQIKRYERERAALKQKIAEERAKVAAKVGAAIMKAIGDDRAEAFAADVIAAVKKKHPPKTSSNGCGQGRIQRPPKAPP